MTTNRAQAPVIWLGIVLLFGGGCSALPDSSPRWCGGMAEYSLENNDLKNDWQHATNDSNDSTAGTNSTRSDSDRKQVNNFRQGKEKLSLFQQLFGFHPAEQTDSKQKNHGASLYAENRFYPVDHYMDLYRLRQEQASLSPAALQEITLDEPMVSTQDKPKNFPRNTVKPPVPVDVSTSSEIDSLITTLESKEILPLSSLTATRDHIPMVPANQTPSMGCSPRESGAIRQVQHIDTIVKTAESEYVPPKTVSQANWKEQTESAISLLEKELTAKKLAGTLTPQEQMRLKLLYLSVDKQVKEEMPRGKTEPVEQFWQEQYRGLSVMLGGTALGGTTNATLSQATEHFQRGLDSLRQECPLLVRKALFVQNVAPFGLYKKREESFAPGDVAYLYAELENVVSRRTSGGEEIVIDCAWELLDQQGKTVVPVQKETCSSLSQSLLRDIVLNISVTLPNELAKGRYTLELTLIDRRAEKPTPLRHKVDLTIP